MTQQSRLPDKLRNILAQKIDRATQAARVAEAIKNEGTYRWVGIYDVDIERAAVSNIAWSGPSGPAHPTFPIGKGLTSRAIASRKTINVGDVASDPGYLTALETIRAEIIIPVLNKSGDRVIGTIDIASEHSNAFGSETQSLLEECAPLLREFLAGKP